MKKRKIISWIASILIIILVSFRLGYLGNDEQERPPHQTPQSEQTPSSSQQKGGKSDYTAEANTQFAAHLMAEMNHFLASTGSPIRIEASKESHLDLYVPQNTQNNSQSEMQQLADSLLKIKDSTFQIWATDKGYDPTIAKAPKLRVKSEDGTLLAEENSASEMLLKENHANEESA